MTARCHEQVIDRDGFYAPCDRPATTTRTDPEDGHEYPVCAQCARPNRRAKNPKNGA